MLFPTVIEFCGFADRRHAQGYVGWPANLRTCREARGGVPLQTRPALMGSVAMSLRYCTHNVKEIDMRQSLARLAAASCAPSVSHSLHFAHVCCAARVMRRCWASIQVNGFDVETALLARAQASSNDVRTLATHVSADHMGVRQAAFDLAAKCNVSPVLPASRVGAALEHGKAMTKLAALTGTEFDKSYLLREVAFHRSAIDAV